MAAPRSIRSRSRKFDKNVTQRGQVNAVAKADEGVKVSTPVLMLFLFLLVGSGIVQIFLTIGAGPIFK
eukprot:CAMPEP_0118884894 /NCGR_PEP_ID=MMETSP1163-20130328/23587_1 /TAXON_ID=124430 /ORGANISM="Phaeomonas parva, Strain CCMP2877" /LENGTH=67 /DNA_ID=CAMNT_0006822805 /DNA_START=272 /DNA_END=475 /DNA_ORIENTATION=+